MSAFMYAEDRWDPEEPHVVETSGPLRIYDDDPQEWPIATRRVRDARRKQAGS